MREFKNWSSKAAKFEAVWPQTKQVCHFTFKIFFSNCTPPDSNDFKISKHHGKGTADFEGVGRLNHKLHFHHALHTHDILYVVLH